MTATPYKTILQGLTDLQLREELGNLCDARCKKYKEAEELKLDNRAFDFFYKAEIAPIDESAQACNREIARRRANETRAKNAERSAGMAGKFKVGDVVQVDAFGKWRYATVLKVTPTRLQVRFVTSTKEHVRFAKFYQVRVSA